MENLHEVAQAMANVAFARYAKRRPGALECWDNKYPNVYHAHIVTDRGITTALVSNVLGEYVGSTKRNPQDANNPRTGKMKALNRAVKKLVKEHYRFLMKG